MSQTATQSSLGDTFDPIALSLVNRHSPGGFRSVFGADAARSYAGMSLRTALEQTASRAGLTVRNAMTSDDFTRIINDVANVAGIMGYSYNQPEILKVSHETQQIENFKPQERVRGGVFPSLKEVPEGAEITYGTIGEAGETYSAARYSRMLEVTEQAIINDSLGLLVQPALRIGEATADLKASVVVDRIVSNPILSDGNAVFSVAHGNLGGGSSLAITGLSAARTAMRRQKHVDGERPINVEPVFLVVPPELETEAQKQVASITANIADEVNPFSGNLIVLTEPRLIDADAWYLFARPERQLALEHGGINGTSDPEIRSEARMERHSVVTRVTVDFACGWIDWRGAYKNPGL
ncbi:Mu-like prophage major head subunit gpT family protein [Aurantimonas sp. A2-1-M11]|uniref:phage major capsid protein n=1 Tax=Aurantimonas sp. A2-1-M11 TaxID=3113712 RepID=UPI002F9438B3